MRDFRLLANWETTVDLGSKSQSESGDEGIIK